MIGGRQFDKAVEKAAARPPSRQDQRRRVSGPPLGTHGMTFGIQLACRTVIPELDESDEGSEHTVLKARPKWPWLATSRGGDELSPTAHVHVQACRPPASGGMPRADITAAARLRPLTDLLPSSLPNAHGRS